VAKATVKRASGRRAATRPVVASRTPDEWERGWQRTWKKLGFVPYELPADDSPAGQEQDFLTNPRTAEGERERLARIQEEFERGFRALGRLGPAVTVFGSARFKEGHRYYELAREVGRELARAGFATITGGGPGIMEAANRGAQEAGGKSYGLNILLPHEQGSNPYVDASVEFRYFFMRKLWFAYVARAIIVFPGGYGTLDELFEFLTLSQTGKIDPPVATLLYGTRYWNEIVDFDALVRHGTVSADDLKLLHFVDTPAEAMAVLRKRLGPQDEEEAAPAIARSVTPEDECATCGPEKEERP
jgi:uncharacterized protein (TIGR00730 family)